MSLYNKSIKTTPPNILKGLLQSVGASPSSPYIAGKRVSATLNFPNTLTLTSSDLTIACDGANVGDQVVVGTPAPPANGNYTGFVAAADLVTIRFTNSSAGSLNPGSGTFIATVIPSV